MEKSHKCLNDENYKPNILRGDKGSKEHHEAYKGSEEEKVNVVNDWEKNSLFTEALGH